MFNLCKYKCTKEFLILGNNESSMATMSHTKGQIFNSDQLKQFNESLNLQISSLVIWVVLRR